MLIHNAAKKEVIALDFWQKSPASAFRTMFVGKDGRADPKLSRESYQAVAVPGTVRVPRFMAGKTLLQTDVRKQYGVTIVGVKRPREPFIQAVPDTVVYLSDLLIVSGPTDAVERFAALT